jgi:hypothetical protein
MEQYPQPDETAQEAYEQRYQELTKVTARVFNKIIGHRDNNREKTWAEVGDLGHIIEMMQELDEFLGV